MSWFDEQEIQRAGGEPVSGQGVQGPSAVADGADHAGDPVGDPGVRPDAPGVLGVGGGHLDGEHPGLRCRPGDPQCAVAAVGAQFEGQAGIRASHGRVEQQTFLVADIDQDRLLVGEAVDGGDHIVEVTRAGVGQHVLDGGGFAAVAHLSGPQNAGQPDGQPPERPAQEGDAVLKGHAATIGPRRWIDFGPMFATPPIPLIRVARLGVEA